MFNADTITFREFAMREPLPSATIQSAILEFLRGRDDVVLFGAQAVNAYTKEPRMTQDVDLLSTRAKELAKELREHLMQKFHIAVRVREVGGGKGFRLYQVRKEGSLVNVQLIERLPQAERIEDVLVLSPAELIASKIISYYSRKGRPKSGTDWRDLAMLLLTFPQLKNENSEVAECLRRRNRSEDVLQVWQSLAKQEMQFEDEDEDLTF
jgi:hypothetical protein